MFEKWQNAVLGHLFPPGLRCLDLKSVRIPASNRLACKKICTNPAFRQERTENICGNTTNIFTNSAIS